MFKKSLAILFASLLSSNSLAYTVYDAIISAHENNPNIIAEAKKLKATKMNRYIALSGFLPTVSATSAYSKSKGNRGPLKGQSSDGRVDSLTLNQALFEGGKTISNIGKAENGILASVYAFNNQSAALAENVVKMYENVDMYHELVKLNEESEEGYLKTLESSEIRFKYGDSTITDVHNAKAYYEEAKARTELARANLKSSIANFEYYTGHKLPEAHDPVVLDESNIPESLEEALELAVQNNPQVKSAYHNSQAANFDVGVTTSDLLPSVQASLSTSKSNTPASQITSLANDKQTAAIQVSIPIFSGSLYPSVAQSRYSAEAAKYSYRNSVEAIKAETISAWNRYVSTKASIDALRQSAESFRLAFEGFREEVKIGTNTIVVLLDAQRNYYNKLIELRQREAEYKQAIYGVLRLTNLSDNVNIDKLKLKDDK